MQFVICLSLHNDTEINQSPNDNNHETTFPTLPSQVKTAKYTFTWRANQSAGYKKKKKLTPPLNQATIQKHKTTQTLKHSLSPDTINLTNQITIKGKKFLIKNKQTTLHHQIFFHLSFSFPQKVPLSTSGKKSTTISIYWTSYEIHS